MERIYILELCNNGLFCNFLENRKWEIFKKNVNFIIWTYNIHGLYGLYLGNPSTYSILLSHMQRTYCSCLTGGGRLFFFNLKKKREFSYMDLRYS